MESLTEHRRFSALPWSVRAFLVVALLVPVCALAVSNERYSGEVVLFGLGYVGAALLFVVTRNDWLRFAFSGCHFILSGAVLYGIFLILPGRDPDALFPLRVVLIFGATLVTTALLWHPDTGRWVLKRA